MRRFLATTLKRYNRLINGFFLVAVLYPVGLLAASFTNPDLSIGWQNFIIILIASGVFPLIKLLAFRASRDVDAGLYTILSNIAPIITIVAAAIFLSESLNGWQQMGVAIVLTSALLASLLGVSRRSIKSSPGLVYALVSITLLGLAIVFERWMLTRVDFGAYLVFGWGAQALWMAIIAWPERRYIKIIKNKANFLPILGYGVANSLKGLCFLGALHLSGNASIVGVSSSFMAVLVVVAAYFVLKEREWLGYKTAVAVFGAIGLIILSIA